MYARATSPREAMRVPPAMRVHLLRDFTRSVATCQRGPRCTGHRIRGSDRGCSRGRDGVSIENGRALFRVCQRPKQRNQLISQSVPRHGRAITLYTDVIVGDVELRTDNVRRRVRFPRLIFVNPTTSRDASRFPLMGW